MAGNPFFVSGPVSPEAFVGRDSSANIAFDQIAKRAHTAFYGSPGMGKSSLLRYLAAPDVWRARGKDRSTAIAVFLNCSGIAPFTPEAFWREMLLLVRDELDADGDNSADDEALYDRLDRAIARDRVEIGDVRRVLRQIGQQDRFLLLLLDDYDAALHPHDRYTEAEMLVFLSEFRDLAVHRKEGAFLSTVVTTFRRLTELGPTLPPSGSPWYNHYLFEPLKPLSDEEVRSQFFSPQSPLFIPASPAVQTGIRAIADGHPALLQNAGYLLYDTLRDGELPNIADFTLAFESRTEQYFLDTWRFSTDIEQVLLMLVALSQLEGQLGDRQYAIGDIDLIFSQRTRELIDLEERGVLRRVSANGKTRYEFASSMMEWWVVREIENSDEAALRQREKIFLRLMSRERAAQLQALFRTLWEHRDTVQSVLAWIARQFLPA